MARDDPQFNLRMSQALKDKIAARAKENGRSLNAEIVQILEDAVDGEGRVVHDNDLHTLREVIKIQADLLSQYSEVISQGTEILQAANSKNKKTT